MSIKHAFTSAKGDGADSSLVRATNWNADHIIDDGTITAAKLASGILGAPLGLTGAVETARFVGGTTAGAPTEGTFAARDYVIDGTGKVWVCTSAGSPGVWAMASGVTLSDNKATIATPKTSPGSLDDEFSDLAGQSGPLNGLHAKWLKHNLGTSGWLSLDDTKAPGCLLLDIPTGQATDQWIYQAVPAGNFTVMTLFSMVYCSDRQMFGPAILDSSGNGVGIRFDNGDTTPRIMEINSWQQTSSVTDLQPNIQAPMNYGLPVHGYIKMVGSTFTCAAGVYDRALFDGLFQASRTRSFTPAYVGWGRTYGGGQTLCAMDAFRVF